MANENDYKSLETRWPLSDNQRGSPELDALINIAKRGTREEERIANGDYYTSSVQRPAVPSGNIYSRVIRAGERYQVIESLSIDIDYGQLGDGVFTVVVRAYLDASDGSSFSYDDSSPAKFGRNLNGAYINQRSELDVFVEPLIGGVVGDPDYILYYAQFFIDTQGSRNILTGTTVDFFDDSRKIVIPPNHSMLLQTETSGDAAGTVDMFSKISWSETVNSEDV